MTAINSALFNPGWRERLGIDYGALRLVATGERLTAESFARYHASPDAGLVIIDTNPDEIVDEVMLHPLTMVASDGLIAGGKGHPRGAGTFARVLARYVRSQGRLSLMDAIRKSSLMPAQRLEGAVPAARRKGRLQEGGTRTSSSSTRRRSPTARVRAPGGAERGRCVSCWWAACRWSTAAGWWRLPTRAVRSRREGR